jgi:hypothetical protein
VEGLKLKRLRGMLAAPQVMQNCNLLYFKEIVSVVPVWNLMNAYENII